MPEDKELRKQEYAQQIQFVPAHTGHAVNETPSSYTNEELIEQLKAEGILWKRKPTSRRLLIASKAGRTAHPETFRQRFGSLEEAQKLADFDVKPRNFTDTQLLEQLGKECERLGYQITKSEIKKLSKLGKMAGYTIILERFGSLPEAIKRAGAGDLPSKRQWLATQPAADIQEKKARRKRRHKFTDDQLLEQLGKECERLGYQITKSEIKKLSKLGKMAGDTTIWGRFGSLPEAIKRAGAGDLPSKRQWLASQPSHEAKKKAEREHRHQSIDTQLLKRLRRECERLGYQITNDEIRRLSKRGKMPRYTVIGERLGGLQKAIKKAGAGDLPSKKQWILTHPESQWKDMSSRAFVKPDVLTNDLEQGIQEREHFHDPLGGVLTTATPDNVFEAREEHRQPVAPPVSESSAGAGPAPVSASLGGTQQRRLIEGKSCIWLINMDIPYRHPLVKYFLGEQRLDEAQRLLDKMLVLKVTDRANISRLRIIKKDPRYILDAPQDTRDAYGRKGFTSAELEAEGWCGVFMEETVYRNCLSRGHDPADSL